MKIVASMILAVLIGAACRWFEIPVPAPPRIIGALLVVAMTVGYLATDKMIATKSGAKGIARTTELSAAPTSRHEQ
jgi:XapX domain-containing protein